MIWNCTDKKAEYGKRTLLMGIINVTPDSFSDGGECFSAEKAVERALKMQEQGADIIDIGAQSTRPDSTPITEEEEWSRLEPVLTALRGRISVLLSVDTYYPTVAEKSLEYGVNIINDVSGVISHNMAKIVRKSRCGWILMHNGAGSPEDVRIFFEKAIAECEAHGIDRSQLCFDMGIGLGFGKNYDENMRLLTSVGEYKPVGVPLMLGVSRKRVIGQGSGQPQPEKRIYGNIAVDTLAVLDGVDIIRLHDIENESQGIRMADELKKFRKL